MKAFAIIYNLQCHNISIINLIFLPLPDSIRLKTKIKVLENEYMFAKKKASGETTNQDIAFIEELKKDND